MDYTPELIKAEDLDRHTDFERAFLVNEDGTVELSGNWCPDDVLGTQGHEDPSVSELGWEFFSRGYTGQYGYNGPEMHPSEFIGGRLAEDILATPGEYAVCPVRYECDEDMCGDMWTDGEESCGDIHYEGWVILRKDVI